MLENKGQISKEVSNLRQVFGRSAVFFTSTATCTTGDTENHMSLIFLSNFGSDESSGFEQELIENDEIDNVTCRAILEFDIEFFEHRTDGVLLEVHDGIENLEDRVKNGERRGYRENSVNR